MSRDFVLVAGGDPAHWPVDILKKQAHFVGVDRGNLFLLSRGIVPAFAVGDFDSISQVELKNLEEKVTDIHYSIPEKDDTDTELALLEIFKRNPHAKVNLIGATGGRLDHFLSNLWLPLDERFMPFISQLQISDDQNTIVYFKPGKHEIFKEIDKKYVAIVCLTPVNDLTILDAKYCLSGKNVSRPMSYASNEFVEETLHFSFTSGVVAVIQSKDKN